MMLFILGLIVFFATHYFTAFARGPRAALVEKLGANGYKGAYSLLSLAGFALIVIGWPNANASVLYTPPYFLRHITYLLTLIAFVLLAAAYLPRGRIAAGAKHPMIAGVKVWAFSHLLVNGEVRSVILFGAFLAFGVLDRIAVKRRDEPLPGPGGPVNDVLAIAVGAGAWAAVYLYLHPIIAGVAIAP